MREVETEGPVATVVIPALNSAATIGEQLAALRTQENVGTLEIIVVDNGSTDDTVATIRHWQQSMPNLRVLDAADKPGPSHARNRGIEAASSDLILLCDADDVVDPRWAHSLLARAADAAIVGGRAIWVDHAGSFLRDDEQFIPRLGFLPGFGANNALLHRDVWNAVGRFDEGLLTAEDLELAWRVQLAGHRVIRDDDALVRYRQRGRNRDVFMQGYRHGRGTVQVFKRYRTRGMPRSSTSVAVKAWTLLILRAAEFWAPRDRRTFWYRRLGTRWGRLTESARQRTLYL